MVCSMGVAVQVFYVLSGFGFGVFFCLGFFIPHTTTTLPLPSLTRDNLPCPTVLPIAYDCISTVLPVSIEIQLGQKNKNYWLCF